jgi:hypothetical protein
MVGRLTAIDADGPLTQRSWAMYSIRRDICYVRTHSPDRRYAYKIGRSLVILIFRFRTIDIGARRAGFWT